MVYVACADGPGNIDQYELNRNDWTATRTTTWNTGVANSWMTFNADKDMAYVNARSAGRITTLSRTCRPEH